MHLQSGLRWFLVGAALASLLVACSLLADEVLVVVVVVVCCFSIQVGVRCC
jgi:hypothetical protein